MLIETKDKRKVKKRGKNTIVLFCFSFCFCSEICILERSPGALWRMAQRGWTEARDDKGAVIWVKDGMIVNFMSTCLAHVIQISVQTLFWMFL